MRDTRRDKLSNPLVLNGLDKEFETAAELISKGP